MSHPTIIFIVINTSRENYCAREACDKTKHNSSSPTTRIPEIRGLHEWGRQRRDEGGLIELQSFVRRPATNMINSLNSRSMFDRRRNDPARVSQITGELVDVKIGNTVCFMNGMGEKSGFGSWLNNHFTMSFLPQPIIANGSSLPQSGL